MNLPRARKWLRRLTSYLYNAKIGTFERVTLRHSKALDARNKRSSRSFCQVECGSSLIHCAEAIEKLESYEIVGLLLHEIAHIATGCDNDDDEVTADQWIADKVTKSGYYYASIVHYESKNGRTRVAENLESVSNKFVVMLRKY